MEAFNSSDKTVCYPFSCESSRHGVCQACNKRMFLAHDDSCPMCRAPRLGSSIAELGWRPPREREQIETGIFNGGRIFFPVVEDDSVDSSISIVEFRRITVPRNETNSTAVNDVLSDPVVMAAIDGLRNPGRVTIAAFLSTIGEARRARYGSHESV